MCDSIRKELAAQIAGAFQTAQYPGDEDITIDHPDWEVQETLAAFKGKHWKQVEPTSIFLTENNLSFFTVEAFCYYLPAYLAVAAFYSEWVPGLGDVNLLIDCIASSLTPPTGDIERMEQFLRRAECFTAQQRKVIETFFSLCICQLYITAEIAYKIAPELAEAIRFWENGA